MSFLKKFINLMKSELLKKKPVKRSFSWVIDESKYLKLHEVKELRKACREARKIALNLNKTTAVRDWFMVELGLNTGLRVEEMTNLKCADLHIEKEQSSLSVRRGKGGKPRTVRLNDEFKNNCRWFLEWKKKHGQQINADSYLLTGSKGNQLCKRALQKAFKRCTARAELPAYFSIHSLRHTYGTHLLKASNYNLRLVQEQLGHSSVRITEVYTSLIDSDVRNAVENLYVR